MILNFLNQIKFLEYKVKIGAIIFGQKLPWLAIVTWKQLSFWPQICAYSCLSPLPGISHPNASAKFCLLSAWKWCHLWPPCMHFVATKCVRLCTCIIGIKFCEQQQPMLKLMFNLNTAMMPAGLCTMGVTLFLKKHSQFPPRPTFSRDNVCFKENLDNPQ